MNRRTRRVVYDTSYTTYVRPDAARCQGFFGFLVPDALSTDVVPRQIRPDRRQPEVEPLRPCCEVGLHGTHHQQEGRATGRYTEQHNICERFQIAGAGARLKTAY